MFGQNKNKTKQKIKITEKHTLSRVMKITQKSELNERKNDCNISSKVKERLKRESQKRVSDCLNNRNERFLIYLMYLVSFPGP